MKLANTSKKMLLDKMLEKGRKFCAYRDRTVSEAMQKLNSLGASQSLATQIVQILQDEQFIDEQRFALSFARGKLENNKWGKNKIKYEMQARGINPQIINQALESLDLERYLEILNGIAQAKIKTLSGLDEFTAKGKTADYCSRKGFEMDLVWKALEKLNFGF